VVVRGLCFVVLIALCGWSAACGTSAGEAESSGGETDLPGTVTSPEAPPSRSPVGWRDVTVEMNVGDAAHDADGAERSVGSFGARVFYPAVSPGGEDAELDADDGPYPVIAFGHGYLGRIGYYADTLQYLAARGYLVIAPTSQGGLLPDHSEFANELLASLRWLVERGGAEGSPFFAAVDPSRLGLSGHSMGGGCALLAAARDARIAAVSTLAAADTMPSSLDVLDGIEAPVQSIAGSSDAIASPQGHQIPLFEAVPPPRQLVIIKGGSHCGFLDDPPPICDSGSIPPEEQIELTRGLLRDWFGLYLKGDAGLRDAVWRPAPDPRVEIVSDP